MTESTPERPLTPEAPAPPGKEHLTAPELTFSRPEGRDEPADTGGTGTDVTGTDVTGDAGLIEPPD